MGVVARRGLVAALRTRIADDRPTVAAFSLSVTAEAKSALLEIRQGILTVTVEGGENVKSLRFVLSDPRYGTVAKLITEFSKLPGYSVVSDVGYVADHPSIDIVVPEGIVEIAGQAKHTFRHRIFSDEDLKGLLNDAINVHNPNYTQNTVPEAEHPYVIKKAAAAAYRAVAADSAKRRGLDTDAKVFLQLARDLEKQYETDTTRQARLLPSARIDESKVGPGDAISGELSRRSPRAGYTSPYRASLAPEPPHIIDPSDDDVEDTLVRLRWNQDRDSSFSYYELWRDTQPVVERSVSGRLEERNGPTEPPQIPITTQYSRANTAIQVLGLAVGANRLSPVFDGFFFWTAAELAGSNIVNVSFVDGVVHPNPGSTLLSALGEPMEPEFTYYYRLYTINWNGEVQHSNVVKITTKKIRARFKQVDGFLATDAIAPLEGPLAGGTTVTVKGTNFHDGMKVLFGGKPGVSLVVVSPTEATVDSPGFTNEQFKEKKQDVVMVSTTGLKDIAKRGWTYT